MYWFAHTDAEIEISSDGKSAILAKNGKNMEHKLYCVPREIDVYVAKAKLEACGISIDTLSEEQEKYLNA